MPKTEPVIKQENDPVAPKGSICNEELEILKLLFEKQYEPSPKRQRMLPSPILEKDFQCCICSLNFNKKIILVLHLRNAHSKNPAEASSIVEEQLREEEPNYNAHPNYTNHVLNSKKLSETGKRNIPILIDIEQDELNLLNADEVASFNDFKSTEVTNKGKQLPDKIIKPINIIEENDIISNRKRSKIQDSHNVKESTKSKENMQSDNSNTIFFSKTLFP